MQLQDNLTEDPQGVTKWSTRGGSFTTTQTCLVPYQLPEFTPNQTLTHRFWVNSTPPSHANDYDIIIGQDILRNLGLLFEFKTDVPTIKWDNHQIVMRKRGFWTHHNIAALYHASNLEAAEAKFNRCSTILPASYKEAHLQNKVPKYLTATNQQELLALVEAFSDLFQGKLGIMPGRPFKLKLKPNAIPYHAQPFPVPKKHEKLIQD